MRRILVVEDDIELARMLEEYLVPEGFAVELLHDGGSVAVTSLHAFDLIIRDPGHIAHGS
jgi:DNA-binding response OmpR family regulator